MKNKMLAVVNAVSVVLVIYVNYYSQVVSINGNNVGELSARYDNLFTPAGYAFSIWGIIFLGLIAYALHQLITVFGKSDSQIVVQQTGYWFALANVGNATWVIVWLYELTALSVIVMSVILVSLLMVVVRTKMKQIKVKRGILLLNWLPVIIYTGWISVAIIANTSAYLSKIGWEGGFLSEVQWTFAMIVIAALVNVFMVLKKNMWEFGLVGIWALMAIYMRQQDAYNSIATVAMMTAGLIGASILIIMVNKVIATSKQKMTDQAAR